MLRLAHGRKLHVAALAIVIFAAGAGCRQPVSGGPGSARTPGPALEKVTICQFAKVFVYLPLYVAVEKGFFEKEGLKVELVNGGGDDKTFATVVSGQAQFGVADPTFTAIAREKGQPASVVASVVAGVPFWGVTKNPNIKAIRQPSQLKDLRIATYQAPSTNYTLMSRTLKQNAAAVGKARIVEGAFGALLPMLDAGAADIAVELEPTVSIAVKQGASIVYSYPDAYGAFLFTGLYATERFADEHPDIVQKAVNALERAVRYCHSDTAGTVAVAQKVFPEIDPTVVKGAVERMIEARTIPEHVQIDRKAWMAAVQLRLEAGDLKEAWAAEETVENYFARRAIRTVR